jgi:hypothetical protein
LRLTAFKFLGGSSEGVGKRVAEIALARGRPSVGGWRIVVASVAECSVRGTV